MGYYFATPSASFKQNQSKQVHQGIKTTPMLCNERCLNTGARGRDGERRACCCRLVVDVIMVKMLLSPGPNQRAAAAPRITGNVHITLIQCSVHAVDLWAVDTRNKARVCVCVCVCGARCACGVEMLSLSFCFANVKIEHL